VEAERGVTGYDATQNKLEEISSLKGDIDDTKGKTLEEISQVVTQINQTIKVHSCRNLLTLS
jgi:intraflagellar transport protein 81